MHYYRITVGYDSLSKQEKLLARFKSKPRDFTWEELVKVFKYYGFEVSTNSGSSRKFRNANNVVFMMHEPHPKNIIKNYALKNAIDFLSDFDD